MPVWIRISNNAAFLYDDEEEEEDDVDVEYGTSKV